MANRWLFVLLLLTGCAPEICPFTLAPRAPDENWDPPPEAMHPLYPTDQYDTLCPQGCLGLSELIDMGLSNSPETRTTWAMARAAAAKYGLGRSEYYPDIDVNYRARLKREPDYIGSGQLEVFDINQHGPEMTLSWLLFNFGAREAKNRALWNSLIEANWTHNRKVQTVMQTVMVDYYSYVASVEQVEADRADVENAIVNLDAADARYSAGVADLSDIYQAQTQLSQQRLMLLRDQQKMVDALATLVDDLGLPVRVELCVEGLPEEIPMQTICGSVDQLMSQAYQCRPDLAASLAEIRSRKEKITEAIRNQWPEVDFKGEGGRHVYNGISDQWDYSAQVQVTLPIFKGWWYTNKVREARANLEKAQAQLGALEASIVKEVTSSYQDFNIATQEVMVAQEYVESATGSYEAILAKYRAGTIDFTPLFTALATLANARAALVDARQNWYTSLTDVAYATGTLQ